jgi:hypothetical protein
VPKTPRHVRLSRSTRSSAKRIGSDDHDLLRVLAQASLKPVPSEQMGAARNPAGHRIGGYPKLPQRTNSRMTGACGLLGARGSDELPKEAVWLLATSAIRPAPVLPSARCRSPLV